MACWPAPWLYPAVTRSCADVQAAGAGSAAGAGRDDEAQATSVRAARAIISSGAITRSESTRMYSETDNRRRRLDAALSRMCFHARQAPRQRCRARPLPRLITDSARPPYRKAFLAERAVVTLQRPVQPGSERSQDSATGGGGGPAASQACSALISGPGFFLDLGKTRLLVNSSPQPGDPACKARSTIGLKSLTFSVSGHRFSVLAQANTSSSDFERRSGRSAIAMTSWPSARSSAAMAGENISSSKSLTAGRWLTL